MYKETTTAYIRFFDLLLENKDILTTWLVKIDPMVYGNKDENIHNIIYEERSVC